MRRTDADTLARLLEGDTSGNGEVSDELRQLAALGSLMRASAVRPRSEFKADLRAALIDEARQQASAPPLLTRLRQALDQKTARFRYSTRLAAVSAAAAVAISGGGTAVAAEQALPGELLYPVKLVLEDARLAFVRGDVDRGERHLGHATRRLEEAEASVEADNQPGAARALLSGDESTRHGAALFIRRYQEAGDVEPLSTLSAFTGAHRPRLEGLLPLLEGDAADAAQDWLVILDRIDARIAVLLGGECPGCPTYDAASPPPTGNGGFDFARIPPAHEPFDPCPCPAPAREPTPQPSPDQLAPPAVLPEDDPEPEPPADDPGPGDPPPEDPDDDDRVVPTLPGPAEEPSDVLDDVIKDVLEDLPVDPDLDQELQSDLDADLPELP